MSGFAWRNRIHDLRLGLHRLNADMVFLQEVQGRNDRHAQRFSNWPEAAQHDFLADAGWAEAVYGRNATHTKGGYASDHGNALLSRFPMLSHENIDVSDHRYESRGLLHCEIQWGDQRLHCICAHLGLFEDSRHRQADALIARIRDHVPDDAPLIIAGDFNDWRGQLCRKLTENLGVQEVFDLVQKSTAPVTKGSRFNWPDSLRGSSSLANDRAAPNKPARTFPSLFPILRLDRVYVRGFSVSQARVMHGIAWRRLSDHAPIVADLVLNEPAQLAQAR